MRYIGNKENLLDKIYQTITEKGVSGNSFFDFFSGTTNVARFFKKKNYQVYSSDLLYFSFVLQKAYIAILRYVLIQIQIRLEEEFLTKEHGQKYLEYKQKVRRLI